MISDALLESLADELKTSPLQNGEFRRIKGMGSHFVCLTPTHDGDEFFFAIMMGDQKIYIYKPIKPIE